jgi:hypothetical protein
MTLFATDSRARALGMALAACLLGYTLDFSFGMYRPEALRMLTVSTLVCIGVVALPGVRAVESLPSSVGAIALAFGILIELAQIVSRHRDYPLVSGGAALVAAIGLLQAFDLKRLRLPLLAIATIAFAVVVSLAFMRYARNPRIDVFMFQQMSADGLLHAQNPYAIRYPSLYPPGTPFYGPGVVGADNRLDYGFPYFPLSLLLVAPAYAIGGDIRFAHAIAIAASAWLMGAARPGRMSGLAAIFFLLTPIVFFVVEQSWTEPLLAFTFALTMFCALRWRPGLPYALGLLLATKQYTVFIAPLAWLLVDQPRTLKKLVVLLAKAAAVALAITLPFVVWDPRAFYRAVVAFQFLQPFRLDALSYLVWIYHRSPELAMARWAPFVSVLPATAFALWRSPRSPAGFAAAVTVVYLIFFAFNKQAFANYYYFVIAAACWACAAGQDSEPAKTRRPQSF